MTFTPPPRLAFGKPANNPALEPLTPATVKAEARRQHEAQLAAEVLTDLPAKGESVHCLMSGRFDLSAVLAATVRRWPVVTLTVATLSANKKSLRELLNELDAGTIGRTTILTSGFFARHNRQLFQVFRDEIRADYPGSVIAFGRSHCKVAVFEFRDSSTPLVFEGSANLRSNDSLEQLACVRDAGLAAFHLQWIDRIASQCRPQDLDRDDETADDEG